MNNNNNSNYENQKALARGCTNHFINILADHGNCSVRKFPFHGRPLPQLLSSFSSCDLELCPVDFVLDNYHAISLITRKPPLEVAPTTLATLLPGCCYLFTASSPRLLFGHSRPSQQLTCSRNPAVTFNLDLYDPEFLTRTGRVHAR